MNKNTFWATPISGCNTGSGSQSKSGYGSKSKSLSWIRSWNGMWIEFWSESKSGCQNSFFSYSTSDSKFSRNSKSMSRTGSWVDSKCI